MQHPYQCIETVQCDRGQQFLLAACGPALISLNLENNTIVSEWPAKGESAAASENNDGERPAKKQKTEKPPAPSNIIKLAITPNNLYAVAITDDKAIHVLSIDESGKLEDLSTRVMPKRPCALQFLPDSSTILIGDKFGDVYSLPLLPLEKEDFDAVPGATATAAAAEDQKPKDFKPSATVLTVHTQRNRKALEAQLKQRQANTATKPKEALQFSHQLLLGHVSMLTDLLVTSLPAESKSNPWDRQRDYILTADRDEHIRLSRGIPQSHITEAFLLAHKSFISRLCLLPSSEILVSGGGDDYLCEWHWPSARLQHKLDLRNAVDELRRAPRHEPGPPIAVSGLWTVPTIDSPESRSVNLVVACEGLKGLLVFPTTPQGVEVGHSITIPLPHAPLDVACVGNRILVSMDAREEGEQRLKAFLVVWMPQGDAEVQGEVEGKVKALEERRQEVGSGGGKALDGLFYGVANLRKRAGGEEEGGAGKDEA